MQTDDIWTILLPLLKRSVRHDMGWNQHIHFGVCGHNCPCCRWQAGAIPCVCLSCQEMKDIEGIYYTARTVAKQWYEATKLLHACRADRLPQGPAFLPWRPKVLVLNYSIGHVVTQGDMWQHDTHYVNGLCGSSCGCCTATNTARPGCWECKTFVRMRRVSQPFYIMACYRAIRNDFD